MNEIDFKPHTYQQTAIDFIMQNKKCGLFLDMGLGKTVTTLTAIDKLMFEYLEVDKVLIIAPLRVAEDTWSREIYKWSHTTHLTISKILGNAAARRKALAKEANIYVINRENVVWLVDELSAFGGGWYFDMIVVDELSSFKSYSSKRFKSLKKFIHSSKRIVGLTGTPSPNGLIDLWAQLYLLDQGERLGKTITSYRERYFSPDKRNGNVVYSYKPHDESSTSIHEKIKDICISMTASDYLTLPERIDNVINIKFEDKERKLYNDFEKEQYMSLWDNTTKVEKEVTAVHKGALTTKLLQFCNGAVYDENGDVLSISDKKLSELSDIVELNMGKPILCFYVFRHDRERILQKFKQAEVLEDAETIERWNKGEIPLLLTHPQSAGHGLNLQDGGSTIVWFGLTWSLELYQQANARLHRQGQTKPVIIHHLLMEDTAEQIVYGRLQDKKEVQDELIEYLKCKYRNFIDYSEKHDKEDDSEHERGYLPF